MQDKPTETTLGFVNVSVEALTDIFNTLNAFDPTLRLDPHSTTPTPRAQKLANDLLDIIKGAYVRGREYGIRETIAMTRISMPFQGSDYKRGFEAGKIDGSSEARVKILREQDARRQLQSELPKTRRKYLDTTTE